MPLPVHGVSLFAVRSFSEVRTDLSDADMEGADLSGTSIIMPDEPQDKALESAARRVLKNLVAAALSCAKQNDGS
jgi:hypothetical protein